ncbi:MAG TPA: ATP--guanido phosphotransferase, partial [candidate division WOR-3 bacterium]|nr:ATP--guanido phosphotransferase [candidate division WOR-3 bacterium]
LSDLDRVFLAERHMISLDLLADGEGKVVIISRDETLSLMINEEDHIRLQAFAPGLNLEEVFEKVLRVEEKLGEMLNYAYRQTYGILTSCTTNTGTGLRLSVLLHLADIVYSKQLEGLFRNLAKVKVSVRGLYGEGTNVEGNVFQISSLLSLGVSERETLESFRDVVEITLDFEKKSREILLENMKEALEDKIQRSLAILSSARLLSFKETAEYVSAVRLGIGIGKIFDIKVRTLNELLLFSQPAHLQKLFGKEMGPRERDEKRASYVRTKLKAE